MTVAAVVVNFNAGAHLARCLVSLRAAGVAQRLVVDNCSTDSSRSVAAAADPDLRWLDAGANLGYGRAANLGAAAVPASDVLVCNPDLELAAGAVDRLAARLEAEPDVGVVGPRLLNPDGSVYPSVRAFPDLVDAIGHGALGLIAPGNPFTRRYRLLEVDHDRPVRADWVSGACMLVRRAAWDAVSGFDPAFFMYLEDVDLCWRVGRAGWAVAYEPAAEVLHVQGVSASRHPYRMLAAHHRSLWRFAVRTTAGSRRAALPLIGAGLVGRLGVAAASHALADPARRPAVPGEARRRLP